jgi:hypothetical protein
MTHRSPLIAPLSCAWLLALLAVTAACGTHRQAGSSADPVPLPSTCNDYVQAFRDCIARTTPSSDIADKRAQATRERLLAQAQDPQRQSGLAGTCSSALTRLSSACK